jgi:citrate synthase
VPALGYPPLTAPPELVKLARAVTAPLPPGARLTDRLRLVAAAAPAVDPLAVDISPATVIQTGEALLATMTLALPLRGTGPKRTRPPRGKGKPPGVYTLHRRPPETLADMLWPRLTDQPSTPERTAALNAALILLADHDIAASTLAARVAASTRAHPYAVVSAGLAALDGPLHGAASGLTFELLTDALRDGDPVRALGAYMRSGRPVPGFGHALYPDGDPRAATLLTLILPRSSADPRVQIIRGVREAMARRSGPRPNIDFAVAALALLHDMPADAGEAIFAIARTAGWIAHALEEYADRPLRFRPNGRYAGPDPER